MLIEKDEALEIVDPYRDDLIEAIRGAWDDYMNRIPVDARAVFDATTRANIVHSFIRHRFLGLVDKHQGIRIPDTGKMLLALFGEAMAMKVKKLNEGLLSRNVTTGQLLRFRFHRNLRIPGIPDMGHVELGYELDSFGQAMRSIWLLCPNGLKRNYWTEPMWGESAGTVADMFPIDTPSEPYQKFTAKEASHEEQDQDAEEDKQ